MRKAGILLTGLFLTSASMHADANDNHGHHGDGNSRAVKLAWLANDPANTYDGAALSGALGVADAAHSTVEAFFAGFDPDVQLQQCLDAVHSHKFNAIAVLPADSVSIVPCVVEAKKRHIPVVAVDLPIGPDITTFQPQVPGQAGAVLIPAADWGSALAALIADLCSTEAVCNVGYIAGAFTTAFDVAGLQDLDALAEDHPNIHIVAREEAFFTREIALGVAETILAEHPDIRIMIGAGDQMAQGIEDAVLLQPPAEPIKIIGAGAGTDGVAAVRAGRWFGTFVALPRDEGVFGADIAIRAARGQRIDEPGINPVIAADFPAFFTTANQAEFVGFEPQW